MFHTKSMILPVSFGSILLLGLFWVYSGSILAFLDANLRIDPLLTVRKPYAVDAEKVRARNLKLQDHRPLVIRKSSSFRGNSPSSLLHFQ